MKQLPKQLFKTFLFSVIISIAVNSLYYSIKQKGVDYSHGLPQMMEGITLLNIIIFVMSLPSLFLVNMVYWNNLTARLILYFSGPVIFMITALCMNLQPANRIVYLLTGIIFIIVHLVFYYLTVKKARGGR